MKKEELKELAGALFEAAAGIVVLAALLALYIAATPDQMSAEYDWAQAESEAAR